MIWSVSTLLRRSGTPTPVCWLNFSMTISSLGLCVSGWRSDRLEVGQRAAVGRDDVGAEVGDGRQRAADGRGGRHQRRHEVRATALALPPLEVAVRRGRGLLP